MTAPGEIVPEQEPLFVHFDGTDFAGKTTAALSFVEQRSGKWEIRRNTLSDTNPISQLADSLDASGFYDVEVIGNLYAAAILADIKTFQEPVENRAQDSINILRSIAFYSALGHTRLETRLIDMIKDHPRFTHSFVLTSSLSARKRRLNEALLRNPERVSRNDMMIIEDPDRFLKMGKSLVNTSVRHFGSTVIDTSKLTPKETLAAINESFKPHGSEGE